MTELSLRLPSLLCGFLYLWAVYRLALRRFGSGPVFLLVVALLTLNPMVFDAMSEARGYGIALAFLTWGLLLILESVESLSVRKFNLAAVCLGLSVAASLAFAVPAVALGVVFLVWGRGWAWPKGQGTTFLLLMFLTIFVLVAVPINRSDAQTFLDGATSLRQTLNEITAFSLGTSLKAVTAAVRVATAILAIAAAVVVILARRKSSNALLVLSSGTFALSLVILLVVHFLIHSRFPQGGSIYLIPLLTLVVTSLLFKWNHKAAQPALYAVGSLLIVLYLSRLNVHAYAAGEEFAGGRTIAKALRYEVGRQAVRIGVSQAAEPVINYYRTRYRQGNWERIERKPLERGYQYYVLAGPDRALVEQWHLHVIYKDAGLILAQ